VSRGRVHSDCEVSVLGDEDLTAHTHAHTRRQNCARETHTTQRNSTYVASVSTQITGAPAPSCLERVTSERMYPSALAWHSPWPARVAHQQERGRSATTHHNNQSSSRSRRTGETEAVRVDHQHADHVAVAEQRGHGGLELLLHGCLEIDGRFVCVIERASGRNEIEEIERDRQRNESLRSPARRLLLYDTIHGARAKTPRRIRG